MAEVKAVAARPFIKWAGGKTYLLPEIKKRIPSTWNPENDLYVEPFLGAGALFWELAPKRAWLNDLNAALMTTWAELTWPRLLPRGTIELDHTLQSLARKYAAAPEETYYDFRRLFNEQYPDALLSTTTAALFIFFNKTCFNGLWRVNRQGHFNVPWGKNPNATIYDPVNLAVCQACLKATTLTLTARDFGDLEWGRAVKGALIYCDPPYVPVSKTANFTSYTQAGFTMVEQRRLADWAKRQRENGAYVIVSNSTDSEIVDYYRDLGFTCDLVQVPRRVNSKGAGRGNVGEYIIY